MSRPMGLSSLRRWDAQRLAPIRTARSPWLRVTLGAAFIAGLLTIGMTISNNKMRALPGASPEIEAAYQRGLSAASEPKCGINEFLGAKK